ncbi:hypothetical protein ACF0H5_016389 [Mactra antiquata]
MSLELSSLHEAIIQNNHHVTQSLIETGSDVNTVFQYETACTRAIKENTGNKIAEVIILSKQFDKDSENADGKTSLYIAAELGDLEIVKLLVSRGCDINQTCIRNETPLMASARSNNYMVVKYLCEYGADINKSSRSGETALYQACSQVNFEIVKYLLSKGADVNIKTNDFHSRADHTPLMVALPSYYNVKLKEKKKSEALKIVKYLISHGCDVNAQCWNGNTALHLAAECNDVHTVCVLAKNGANLHTKNKFGKTAFEDSVQPNKQMYDVAYAMILYGYDVDKVSSNEHPLLTILNGYSHTETKYFPYSSKRRQNLLLLVNDIISKNQDILDKLKKLEKDFGRKNRGVYNCLLENQRPHSLKWMCRKTIRTSLKTNIINAIWSFSLPNSLKKYVSLSANVHQDPLLSCECMLAIQEDDSEEIAAILNSGIDLNFKLGDHIPLTEASKLGKIKICKLLIQNGANVDSYDNKGLTALHWAGVEGNLELIRELISTGADVNCKDELNNENVLIKAAANGHFTVMMFLLHKGCCPNVVDDRGCSALHYTCLYGVIEPTIALLSYGVSPKSRDLHGNTPLHVIASNGRLYSIASSSTRNKHRADNISLTLPEEVMSNYCTIAKLLLQSGAGLYDMNKYNSTPLDIAEKFHCHNIISLFS